jgi:hypothetical protein
MKLYTKLLTGLTAIIVGTATIGMAFAGSASADCFQYNANGFNTSSTPVFNNICGVPNLGNESDFVRIRQNPATTPAAANDEAANPAYSVGTINEACNNGDLFDVWNYLHNDASADDNPDTGSGSAVAHNVTSTLTAPLGTTASNFKFSDTVTASNAASVSDSATLNCGNKEVKLSLVPSSVHTLTAPTGGWNDISDNSLNTPLTLGNPTWGSGDMWGCWNYRILIIYEVKVTVVPPVQTPPTCNLLQLENVNGVARIDNIEFTANDANVSGFSLDINNGTTTVTKQLGLNDFPFTYQMEAGKSYHFTATVLSNLGNVPGPNCVGFLTTTTPPTPPPSTPPQTPPTQLVNTGPGSVIAIFLGASAVGTGAYHWLLKKRLASKR